MKNLSIRIKLTAWFTAALIITSAVTFAAVLWAGKTVLRKTVRDYLVAAVEENVDNIKFVKEKGAEGFFVYIQVEDGYLRIDTDYMDVVNDAYIALCYSDGTMIYGEMPPSVGIDMPEFTQSTIRSLKTDDTRYEIYDRKLNIGLPGETLWIRGIVPDTEADTQLRGMVRVSLVILPFVILICALSGYLLSGRLLSPIIRIKDTAEKISNGADLGQRIEVANSNDEIGKLAQVFNSMLGRIEKSFETERQFTSDVSHELRTPTAVILAQAEYALEKERTGEDYIEALETIRNQGRRMNNLITDMLDYTRMEQGSERYAFEDCDLSEIVTESIAQITVSDTKEITLTSDIESGIQIPGNRLLLSRLMQNLLENAYRYGKENGKVNVSLKKETNSIILSVADDGIGIEKDEQEKIFERFYRSDSSRSVKGTGLGLSMVKRIAELHSAEIDLRSEPGKGSDFRIIF